MLIHLFGTTRTLNSLKFNVHDFSLFVFPFMIVVCLRFYFHFHFLFRSDKDREREKKTRLCDTDQSMPSICCFKYERNKNIVLFHWPDGWMFVLFQWKTERAKENCSRLRLTQTLDKIHRKKTAARFFFFFFFFFQHSINKKKKRR